MVRLLVLLFAALLLGTPAYAQGDFPSNSCNASFKVSSTKYQVVLKFRPSLLGYKVTGSIIGKNKTSKITYKLRGIYADGIGLQATATEEILSGSSKRKPKVLNVTGMYLSGSSLWAITISRSKRDKNPISVDCAPKFGPNSVPTVAPTATSRPIPLTPFKIVTYNYTGNIPLSLSWAIGTFGELIIKYESNPPAIFPINASVVQTSGRPATLTFPRRDVVFYTPSSGNGVEGELVIPNGIGCDGTMNQTTQGKIITKATITEASGQSSSWMIAWYCCPDFVACPAY